VPEVNTDLPAAPNPVPADTDASKENPEQVDAPKVNAEQVATLTEPNRDVAPAVIPEGTKPEHHASDVSGEHTEEERHTHHNDVPDDVPPASTDTSAGVPEVNTDLPAAPNPVPADTDASKENTEQVAEPVSALKGGTQFAHTSDLAPSITQTLADIVRPPAHVVETHGAGDTSVPVAGATPKHVSHGCCDHSCTIA